MTDAFREALISSAPRPVRKKFAKPPVKVACLPCRASRTRCGGQEPCSNCLAKGRKCTYLPSKRGGPRKKKQQRLSLPPDGEELQDEAQFPDVSPADFDERMRALVQTPPAPTNYVEASGMFSQIDELSMPGAGLRHLDFNQVNSMFPGFYDSDGNTPPIPLDLAPLPMGNNTQLLVRLYKSEVDILNAYYDFIHIYFPILPPRVTPPTADQPLHCPLSGSSPSEALMVYRPRSPLSLAISAILALIPHPDDPEPASAVSVLRRRTYAHTFAQLANSIIEAESDLDLSSTDPSQALSTPRPPVNREKLHPCTPEDLETLLALLILSVYEYSQRGNLLKMRYRASQALALALDKSLHCYTAENNCAEARRRAWWMTYYCVIQGSIVSTTPPTIIINDPQFTTPYPRFASDAEGWSILIQSQQVLVSATQFIADLNNCLSSQSAMHYMFERMQQLDTWTNSVLSQTELLPLSLQENDMSDDQEITTARSIRAISRIKLSSAQIKTHRFRAFSDIPIFIKKHCDLTTAEHPSSTHQDQDSRASSANRMHNVSCSCSSLDQFQQSSPPEYMTPSDSSTSSDVLPNIPQYPQFPFAPGFPYSPQQSGKVCLRAALVISHMFEGLPYPRPLVSSHRRSQQRSLSRTMPSFACCLMQSSYAMFMIFYKARVAKQLSPESERDLATDSTDRLIEELRQGLEKIIVAVSNYSTAFEALDGMRDEIQGAYQTAFSEANI